MTNHLLTKLTNKNHEQRYKYHHLIKTLHLTLKMTAAQVVEMSVTNNSLSKVSSHPDDHTRQSTFLYFNRLYSIKCRADWKKIERRLWTYN